MVIVFRVVICSFPLVTWRHSLTTICHLQFLGTTWSKIGLDQLCLVVARGASDTLNGSNRLLHICPPRVPAVARSSLQVETSTRAHRFTAKTSEFDYARLARR